MSKSSEGYNNNTCTDSIRNLQHSPYMDIRSIIGIIAGKFMSLNWKYVCAVIVKYRYNAAVLSATSEIPRRENIDAY